MSVIEAQIAKMLAYGHCTRELVALYTHRIIANASTAAAGTFTVIFIYQLFNDSLFATLLVFGAIYFGTGIFVMPAAQFLNRYGIRTLILASLPFLAFCNVGLFLIASGRIESEQGIWLAVFAFVAMAIIYRALYWIPYNTDMSLLLDHSKRGTQVALLSNIADVNVAVMPFWAGVIVALFGFDWLFLLATMLTLLSAIPLFWIENKHEHYSWGFRETLRVLFSSETRPLLLGYSATGIQDGIQIVLWPLIVFLLLDGEYIALGAITALTFFTILLIRYVTGHFFDKGRKSSVLTVGAILSASGWIMKMAVATPFSVFVVDTYHGVGRIMNHTAIDIFAFEQAADNGRFVDEYTVLKEMALAIGRTLALLIVAFGAWMGGVYLGFTLGLFVAAVATLGTTLLSRRITVLQG